MVVSSYKTFFFQLIGFMAVLFLFVLVYYNYGKEGKKLFFRNSTGLIDQIEMYSSKDSGLKGVNGFIILCMLDVSALDMALNFYISSLKKFLIKNYLFIGVGKEACLELAKYDLNCIHYMDDNRSNYNNYYGSTDFNRKVKIRTQVIIEALEANYAVLHSDLDIVFLDNPIPEILKSLQKLDMAILWDYMSYNSGFFATKPSNTSIGVCKLNREITSKNPRIDDQRGLNDAINIYFKKYGKKIEEKIGLLDKKKFLSGQNYWVVQNHGNYPSLDDNHCDDCLVVHNNWIMHTENKIFRFKESELWFYDKNGYYSDKNRKYLNCFFPLILNNVSKIELRKLEWEAFKTSLTLADLLNRTIILPRFHCHGPNTTSLCAFNSFYGIMDLNKNFGKNYRESRFFSNKLVPMTTKSEAIHFNFTSVLPNTNIPVIKFNFTNPNKIDFSKIKNFIEVNLDDSKGIIGSKCLERLKKVESSVLNIYSLFSIQINPNLVRPEFKKIIGKIST